MNPGKYFIARTLAGMFSQKGIVMRKNDPFSDRKFKIPYRYRLSARKYYRTHGEWPIELDDYRRQKMPEDTEKGAPVVTGWGWGKDMAEFTPISGCQLIGTQAVFTSEVRGDKE